MTAPNRAPGWTVTPWEFVGWLGRPWPGDRTAAVYRLDTPVGVPYWAPTTRTHYVWVSTAVIDGVVRTDAFASTEGGLVLDWNRLPGSSANVGHHEPVLRVLVAALWEANTRHRPVEAGELARLLRFEVLRLTDPHPAVREAHVATWQVLRDLP